MQNQKDKDLELKKGQIVTALIPKISEGFWQYRYDGKADNKRLHIFETTNEDGTGRRLSVPDYMIIPHGRNIITIDLEKQDESIFPDFVGRLPQMSIKNYKRE